MLFKNEYYVTFKTYFYDSTFNVFIIKYCYFLIFCESRTLKNILRFILINVQSNNETLKNIQSTHGEMTEKFLVRFSVRVRLCTQFKKKNFCPSNDRFMYLRRHLSKSILLSIPEHITIFHIQFIYKIVKDTTIFFISFRYHPIP